MACEPPPYQRPWRTLTSSFGGSNIRARKLRSTKIGNQYRLNPRLVAGWLRSLENWAACAPMQTKRRRGSRLPVALLLRQEAPDVFRDVILVYNNSYIRDRNPTGFVNVEFERAFAVRVCVGHTVSASASSSRISTLTSPETSLGRRRSRVIRRFVFRRSRVSASSYIGVTNAENAVVSDNGGTGSRNCSIRVGLK
jgi:hypothetical protein